MLNQSMLWKMHNDKIMRMIKESLAKEGTSEDDNSYNVGNFLSKEYGENYAVWAWKGDYLNLGAGAELGMYSSKSGILGLVDVSSPSKDHLLVDTRLSMDMTMYLEYEGKEIASYEKKHWWITSFNPYYPDVNVNNLKAYYTMDFKDNKGLYNVFKEKWGGRLDTLHFNNYKVSFEV